MSPFLSSPLPVSPRLFAVSVFALSLLMGCPSSTSTPPSPQIEPPAPEIAAPLEVDPSVNGRVLWKRHFAVARDLTTALSLPHAQLCHEFVEYDCVDDVFLSALGGNDPYYSARYEREPRPTVVTPMALERLAWSACLTKIDQETAGEGDAVFAPYPLSDDVLVEEDQPALQDLLQRFSRRFFARDALPSEAALLADLVDGSATRTDAAAAVCFALATSAEFLFY